MPAPSARTLVRLLVDKNPLFLLSALLLLGGAWLTNQPGEGGGRDLGMLLRLFATVQGYEVALLAAAWALARRAGLERDVRGLGLLLVPFLMDVSCTNAVVAEHTPTWAADAVLVSLIVALAAVKARVAARLAGVRFDRAAWAALLLGPALVGATPVAASWLRHHGVDPGAVGLGLGLSVAGLLAAIAGAAREGAGPVRVVGATAAAVATLHALATGYGQSGDALHVVGPVLLALGPALPRLLGDAAPAVVTTWSPLLLPVAGAIACGIPGLEAPEASILGVTSWRAGLIVAGGIHAVVLARRGGLAPLLGVALAASLAVTGDGMRASFGSLCQPGAGMTVALTAVYALGLARSAHPLLLGPTLVADAISVQRAQATGDGRLDLALALATLGAGMLAWTHRAHGDGCAAAPWRVLSAGLVWLPLQAAALGGDPLPTAFAQAGVVALLGVAVLTRTRSHALPSVILLLEAARAVTPTTSAGWGGLGLALAFGVVGLGVAVSLQRERLLAWLDAPAPEVDALPAAGRDWKLGLQGALPVAIALALAACATPFGARRSDKHPGAAVASVTGSLRALAGAQSIFAETDKDEDGVRDFASLRELGRLALVDGPLASGQKHGYVFRVVAWAEPAGDGTVHRWAATAAPVRALDPNGRPAPWLRIVDGGPVETADAPLSLPELPDEVAAGK